ncbi:MAG: flagellar biosynthesis protein FlhF [Methylococcales bacterium]
MNIKRFFAADIRQAMKMVKDELGPDAVIMSNRSVDGGVEIVAAKDFDEQLIHQKAQKQTVEQHLPVSPTPKENKKIELPDFEAEKKHLHILTSTRKQSSEGFVPESPQRRNVDQYLGYAEKVQLRAPQDSLNSKVDKQQNKPTPFMARAALQERSKQPASAYDLPNQSAEAVQPGFVNPVETAAAKVVPMQGYKAAEQQPGWSDQLLMEMSKELKYLRSALDNKLSEISWAPNPQTNSVKMELLQRLSGMGISKKLSVKIANRFTNQTDAKLVFAKAQDMLAKVLPIETDELLEYGGIAALVGPTGVGKTTTIAKLAAKFILKHGPKQVALITTDNYRIGAHEQLNTYGRILDVPVRVAANVAELRSLIHSFADKKLILIDTAGMSQRNMKLVEQISMLRQNDLAIKSYLVMSAATEYKAMNEIIKAFQVFDPQASILTKLDEAVSIGSAVSAIIEQNLPLAFITDGQQVPEDMHSPCAVSLIEKCAAELNPETDYTDSNYESWVAQGYA